MAFGTPHSALQTLVFGQEVLSRGVPKETVPGWLWLEQVLDYPESNCKVHVAVLPGKGSSLIKSSCSVLYLVTLIVFGMSLHNQRKQERGHNTPTAPGVASPETQETSRADGTVHARPEAGSATV